MGRLFTYMVKAAAGEQPTPYTGYYGVWDGLYNMGAWETAGHRIRFGGGSSPAYNRYIANRRNYIDRMFAASRSGNSKDWGKLQGAGDYLTALDHDFKDAASIYDILSGNEKYREAIQHLANTGSWAKLKSLAHNGRPSGMRSPFAGDRSDYQLADGVGNAQLIMNMYLAEEARRKAAEEEARRQQTVNTGTVTTASGTTPTTVAPGTVTTASGTTPTTVAPGTVTTPRIGTFSEPAFVSSPTQQVSFYNLPAGMTQEQAMQIWNTTGRSRMQRYLERTGRQGANNIQVSPDGSTLRLMHYNGGSTEMDTSLPIRLTGSNPKALRIYGSNPKAPRSTNSTSKTLLPPNIVSREVPQRRIVRREVPQRRIVRRETGTSRQ